MNFGSSPAKTKIARQKNQEFFVKRFDLVLSTKRAVTFAKHRADWHVCENFEHMHNMTREHLTEVGHTEELPEPEWQNGKGERVGSEEEAFGTQVSHRLLHPERILCADEMGSNTNMTKDKNAGAQKILVGKG
jgi:hypothetical protein